MPTKISRRPEYAHLAKLLVEAREKANVSQNELAKRIGRKHAFIWKIENTVQRPDVIELIDIARALDLDAFEFVKEVEKQSKRSGS